MLPRSTAALPHANLIAGDWCDAAHGARVSSPFGAGAETWPQSDGEDVRRARRAAEGADGAWAALPPRERAERVRALARELEGDLLLGARLAARFGRDTGEFAAHFEGLERTLLEPEVMTAAPARGVAWLAPDWSELLRAPLLELARELVRGRTAVLVADRRAPELAERLALAACAADLPPGVLGLLHGARLELLASAFQGDTPDALVASGSIERMAELRRLDRIGEARLRALRCGVFEVTPERPLAESAALVVERAFAPGATLGGQSPGTLGRVYCPTRCFSRFTELVLAGLEAAGARVATLAQIDEEAAARARAAWELGLDEGATCIAGGDGAPDSSSVPPTIFTNVEPYMGTAKRQDALPVLCLLRS